MSLREVLRTILSYFKSPVKGPGQECSNLDTDRIFEATRAYVEKTFSESYKREMDQDEAVWRTVPFFVATMSAFSALLFYCFSQLPEFSINFWIACGYLLSVLSGGFAFVAFCHLTYAVFPRDYQKIPVENEILDFVRKTQQCALAENLDDDGKDKFALIDIHNMMIEEFADAVTRNRKNNMKRYGGRAWAALCICVAILTAIPLAVGVAINQKMHPGIGDVGSPTKLKATTIKTTTEASTHDTSD